MSWGESVPVVFRLLDSHVHLHEYGDSWVRYCNGRYILVAVSDDLESSLRTVELGKACRYVIPAVGVHPWNVERTQPERALKEIEELISRAKVPMLGEVGLDKIFHPETYDAQLKLFEALVRLASERGLGLSVHAAGAWKEAFELLRSHGIRAAVFHWYTGPHDLLEEIVAEGHFVGVNPALFVQRKHEEVVRRAPLESILTESDGPYVYRGMTLGPELLEKLVARISEIKSVDVEVVVEQIERNFRRFMSYLRS